MVCQHDPSLLSTTFIRTVCEDIQAGGTVIQHTDVQTISYGGLDKPVAFDWRALKK
jgi:hypothetical protein